MLRYTNPCIPAVAISLVPTVSWPVTRCISKARLLSYLSRGEKQRFQQDNALLLNKCLNTQTHATLAKYEVVGCMRLHPLASL